MLDRRITAPEGYAERDCVLVSYRLPLLKRCFVLWNEVPVYRDDDQHAVLHAWRPTIEAICAVLADLDYQLTVGVPDVGQVSPYLAEHIRGNVEAYGVTLAHTGAGSVGNRRPP